MEQLSNGLRKVFCKQNQKLYFQEQFELLSEPNYKLLEILLSVCSEDFPSNFLKLERVIIEVDDKEKKQVYLLYEYQPVILEDILFHKNSLNQDQKR